LKEQVWLKAVLAAQNVGSGHIRWRYCGVRGQEQFG
jgi:hypothetical protein